MLLCCPLSGVVVIPSCPTPRGACKRGRGCGDPGPIASEQVQLPDRRRQVALTTGDDKLFPRGCQFGVDVPEFLTANGLAFGIAVGAAVVAHAIPLVLPFAAAWAAVVVPVHHGSSLLWFPLWLGALTHGEAATLGCRSAGVSDAGLLSQDARQLGPVIVAGKGCVVGADDQAKLAHCGVSSKGRWCRPCSICSAMIAPRQ